MKQCVACNREYPIPQLFVLTTARPSVPPLTYLQDLSFAASTRSSAAWAKAVWQPSTAPFISPSTKSVPSRSSTIVFSGNADLAQRFRTEAIVTRKLRHPNAVFIEDLDVMDDGRPFMVMEFVDGPMLRGKRFEMKLPCLPLAPFASPSSRLPR